MILTTRMQFQSANKHTIAQNLKELSFANSSFSLIVVFWLRHRGSTKSHRNHFSKNKKAKARKTFHLEKWEYCDLMTETARRLKGHHENGKQKCWKQSSRYSCLDLYKWFASMGEISFVCFLSGSIGKLRHSCN